MGRRRKQYRERKDELDFNDEGDKKSESNGCFAKLTGRSLSLFKYCNYIGEALNYILRKVTQN